MKSTGEILKAERLKQDKTLVQLREITKIPEKQLKALEEDDYTSLPPATFAKGFIKLYSEALGLPVDQMLAIFRRDRQEKKKNEIIVGSLDDPNNKQFFRWTPKVTAGAIVATLAIIFLGFCGWQIYKFLLPPKLSIIQPIDNQEVKEGVVEIKGVASENASVYINDQLINLDDKGSFSYRFKLFPGDNVITISATDRRGKKTTLIRHLKLVDKNQ
jgi:cytoskeletal protein RodZ